MRERERERELYLIKEWLFTFPNDSYYSFIMCVRERVRRERGGQGSNGFDVPPLLSVTTKKQSHYDEKIC